METSWNGRGFFYGCGSGMSYAGCVSIEEALYTKAKDNARKQLNATIYDLYVSEGIKVVDLADLLGVEVDAVVNMLLDYVDENR